MCYGMGGVWSLSSTRLVQKNRANLDLNFLLSREPHLPLWPPLESFLLY